MDSYIYKNEDVESSRQSQASSASQFSSTWSESNSIENTDLTLSRASEQRIYSRHTRHLPSRAGLTVLTNKTTKIHLQANKTVRLSRNEQQHLPIDEHVDEIASHMEAQEDLMQDDPLSEMRRIEALREMPQCLTVKRSIKAKLTHSVNLKSKRKILSYWKRFKYSTSIFFMKTTITVREISSTIELWYSAIKSIESHFGSGVATYFKFLRWLLVMNLISCFLSMSFIIVPQSLLEIYSADGEFNFQDIFLGNGFLEKTILFYGFYSNETMGNSSDNTYNMPSAYISTMFCCYSVTFIFLSIKVARSYRKCYIETSGGIHNLYATKIFCSWDYSIASYKAAKLSSSSIYRELKELLAEKKFSKQSNCKTKFLRLLIQMTITTVVIAAMIGSGILIWILLKLHKPENAEPTSLLTIPLVVTGIMSISPVIIAQLVKLERYNSKRTALYVTLIRVYTMAIIVITTLLVYWLSHSLYDCWQTELAQEIYRLIIFDFIIFILGSFIVAALHYYFYTKLWSFLGAPKFDIAQNTLNLIYNQILFWVAFYFSPPLSIVIVVKIILTFYIKKYGLMKHCEPPSEPWRAAQTQTLFLALAFLGMTGTVAMLGYVITSVPCNDCGPFREHNYTWQAIVEEVLNLRRDSELWTVVTNLAKPGVGAAILIAMSMTVYCLRAKAEANKEMVQILREMLVLESKDKDFLLNEFSKVADENWLKRRTAFNESRASDGQREPNALKNCRISVGDGLDNSINQDTLAPSCSKDYRYITFKNDYSE